MRLIDADELMQMIPTEEYNARQAIACAPTVDAEPTEEQVKEYCRKRCLVIVTSELSNEMKAMLSSVPVVRCKDCKWRGNIGCAITIVDESDKPTDDDFCSWGERREDELSV